jgi:cell division protein FtsN
VRYLYNKKRSFHRVQGERSQFAFFVVGAVVLLAVVFVIGLQVGRVVEKNAERRRNEENKVAGPIEIGKESDSEIRKDIGVFSEEAGKIPPVTPPSADSRLTETEKTLTFQETLSKKESSPVLLVKPAPEKKGSEPATSHAGGAGKLMIQMAAFRDRKAAEAFRKRLEKDGWKTAVVQGAAGKSGDYHKVLVGPYPDRDAANRAIRKLKSEWKMNAFLVRE